MPISLYFLKISSGAEPYTIIVFGDNLLTSSARPFLKYPRSALPMCHCFPRLLLLLTDDCVFVTPSIIRTVFKVASYKPHHFVLVKLYRTGIAIIIFIIIIIHTFFTIHHNYPCFFHAHAEPRSRYSSSALRLS